MLHNPKPNLPGRHRLALDTILAGIPIFPAAEAIQMKLAINRPGDEFEREADRIAEQVMRAPEPPQQRKGHTEQLIRVRESFQAKCMKADDARQVEAPLVVRDVVYSPGQPLDPRTRAFMGLRFGYDFSRVRVHADATAGRSAQEMNIHAYAVGPHVLFGPGRYQPRSFSERCLWPTSWPIQFSNRHRERA